MIFFLALISAFTLIVVLYLRQNKFGKVPSGEHLITISGSPNFKKGKFENFSPTPNFTNGHNMGTVLYAFLFKSPKRTKPSVPLPSMKTNIKSLRPEENILVWFGHSSYFIQCEGKRFLVDPVFSGSASPLNFTNKAFPGADPYTAEDMPEIDWLFITHDHYDHLDHSTVLELKNKVKKIICPLGVGAHLQYWGFSKDLISEFDWGESAEMGSGIKTHCEHARHFSGRNFSRNKTLWASFVLETPKRKLYLGADSGYDRHFAEIGKKHGPFDLAILDNGQYNLAWQFIHMLPEEGLKAAKELGAKRLFPAHSGKFAMSDHPWDAPLKTITELNQTVGIPLVTPMIGEKVDLDNDKQAFKAWWTEIN